MKWSCWDSTKRRKTEGDDGANELLHSNYLTDGDTTVSMYPFWWASCLIQYTYNSSHKINLFSLKFKIKLLYKEWKKNKKKENRNKEHLYCTCTKCWNALFLAMRPTQGPMDSTVRDIHRRVGRLTKLLEIVIVITVGMQFRVGFGGSRIACLQEARRSCTRHKIGLRLSYESVCWWCGTSNRWVWKPTCTRQWLTSPK